MHDAEAPRVFQDRETDMATYPFEQSELYDRLVSSFKSQNKREPNDLDKLALAIEMMRLEIDTVKLAIRAVARASGREE